MRTTGIGFGGLLTVAFVVLKLIGTIGWSWWWVLAPTLIPIAFAGVIALAVGIIAIAVEYKK